VLRLLWRLKKDESAAVAVTVALSLFGLIAVGGIAFDYARMATLDTELQNAADQAALAGVTQLDGLPGARARATTAAQSLVLNDTRLSNDGLGRTVNIPTVEFLTDANILATSDADADRVRVRS
jgi:Flp pilus assembly protein TadG